jgi:saccharopine dehydrogenase-like NADP-dependent oxidoreductase
MTKQQQCSMQAAWRVLYNQGLVPDILHIVCSSLQAIIADADLVLHTAGPFQHSNNYNVIEAALETKTPYIDVCDDTHYSEG